MLLSMEIIPRLWEVVGDHAVDLVNSDGGWQGTVLVNITSNGRLLHHGGESIIGRLPATSTMVESWVCVLAVGGNASITRSSMVNAPDGMVVVETGSDAPFCPPCRAAARYLFMVPYLPLW